MAQRDPTHTLNGPWLYPAFRHPHPHTQRESGPHKPSLREAPHTSDTRTGRTGSVPSQPVTLLRPQGSPETHCQKKTTASLITAMERSCQIKPNPRP